MWSGWDRDDFIVDPDAVDQSYCNSSIYRYNQQAYAGVTGGILGQGNLLINIDSVKIKNNHSRALENYLYITSLKHYLVSRGFEFVFTEFADTNLELAALLDPTLYQNYTYMVQGIQPTLGSYNQNYLNLSSDGLHPAPEVHLRWTREILLPYLTKNLNAV
jgi:sensor histidine kinase YesM